MTTKGENRINDFNRYRGRGRLFCRRLWVGGNRGRRFGLWHGGNHGHG
jgi:hypothetical protein